MSYSYNYKMIYSQGSANDQEKGDDDALATAQALLNSQQNITLADKERLYGFLEGGGRIILPEPQAMLTESAKMPGLDGQKMSKSYGNTIGIREDPHSVSKKLKTMPTDPARVRRKDPGDPERCPVWKLHQIYSDSATRTWVQDGCRSAGIGCIDCKQRVIDEVLAEQEPIRERAQEYVEQPDLVRSIIAEGCEAARDVAGETMDDVRQAMGLVYR